MKRFDDSSSKKKKFMISAKTLFLTYPKCSMDISEMMSAVLVLGDVRWAVVAAELHKDGSDHRHVVICFSKKKKWSNAQVLDVVGGKHGDYRACRKVKDVLKYVTKDNNYVVHNIDVEKYLSNKFAGKNWEEYSRLMDEGTTTAELRVIDPGFVMRWLRRVQDYEAYVRSNAVVIKDKWELLGYEGLNGPERAIARWLNGNLFVEREFKQPQLLIVGPPGVGKTSVTKALRRYCQLYLLDDEGKYMDGYVSGLHDLIVVDEFMGRRSATFYNQLLQGGPMPLNVRYKDIMKTDSSPVIVCSNFDLDYFKYDGMAISTLSVRLLVVHVTKDEGLFKLVEKLTVVRDIDLECRE